MLQCKAWVGPCSTDVGGLTPGITLEGMDTVDLLRGLTRVLWRELLLSQRVSIVADWSFVRGVVDVDIRDRQGNTLVFHSIQADGDSALYMGTWPELIFQDAEPEIEWLVYQVEGWLTVSDEALMDAAGYFPGIAEEGDAVEGTEGADAWNDASSSEQLKMARHAQARLGSAITNQDRDELQKWVDTNSLQGGRVTTAFVSEWDDQMRWTGLGSEMKEQIRGLLRRMLQNDPECGCDGLLVLADLADA